MSAPRLRGSDWTFLSSSGLTLYATLSGQSAVFAAFFEGYDASFVLPDEKEDEAGFVRCLDLNEGAARQDIVARYGDFQEICLVAHDRAGACVGGANFIAMPHNGLISANLNYIYILATERRKGHFTRLAAGVREMVATLFGAGAATLVFIEQNDPFAMSEEAYARDTEFTGLDQLHRLRIWANAGARVVDFPYVQPPLSPGQAADEALLFSVYGAEGDALPAKVLHDHLRYFFGISVLKGAPLADSPVAADQVAALAQLAANGERIALIDPSPLLARVRGRDDPLARHGDFRAALKAAL